MPFRTIAAFLDPRNGHRPTSAERKLIEAVQAGEPCALCVPENPARPAAPTDATRIRADLLRLLITGGSKDCGLHERGVALMGGWIEGTLDLAYCKARGQTMLIFCRFPDKPRLEQARVNLLSLDDSQLDQGLFAQGMQVEGNLFLCRLSATGTVDVAGAKIGGQLDCEGAKLDGGKDATGAQQTALNAHGVEVGSDLFLRSLTATGTVAVNGAKIGGQLSCVGAKLDDKRAMLDGGKDAKGAQQKALNAQRMTVGASLFLGTLTAAGTVDVTGAKIGGQLSCTGAKLDGGEDAKGGQQTALFAQGVEVGADLFLRSLTTTGTVAVAGAKIGGQLSCVGAKLDGGKDAKGGQQEALNAQRMTVAQGFFFRKVEKVTGPVNLTAAQVGDLVDDMQSWPVGPNQLRLDGFTYDRPHRHPTFAARRNWLDAGSHWAGEFFPQPYTQFARVLRQIGHAGEARKVLMGAALVEAKTLQKQHRARRRFARSIRRFTQSWGDEAWQVLLDTGKELPQSLQIEGQETLDLLRLYFSPLPTPPTPAHLATPLPALAFAHAKLDFRNRTLERELSSRAAILWSRFKTAFMSLLIGHGHAPQRAITAIALSTLLAAWWYAHAWDAGVIVPNSDVILTSFNWWWAMLGDKTAPTANWSATAPATHYETFYPLAYAFDVLVPLVDLGQTSAWSATTVTWTGFWTRVFTMLLEVWGWVVTALGAAAVTGLVQRNQPD